MKTLEALRRQSHAPQRVRLFDDASADGSVERIRQRHPEVEVVVQDPPAGMPSVGRSRGIAEARCPLVLLLDHDVALEPDAIAEMVAVMADRPGVAAVGPRLLFDRRPGADAEAPDTIYLDRSTLHFLGVSAGGARGVEVDARARSAGHVAPVRSLLGGNMMVRTEVARGLGGFDTGYRFGWGEDAELTVRMQLAGWETLVVPSALGRHEHRPRGLARGEAQFYNRLRLLATIPARRTQLALLPAWAALEVALAATGLHRGCTRLQARAWRGFLGDRRAIAQRRREIQATRNVSDRDLFDARPLAREVKRRDARGLRGAVLKGVDVAASSYWRVAGLVVPAARRDCQQYAVSGER